MLYPHDLISCPETLLLCCTVLLNTGDKDADIISSRQPQTHTVTFLETHHHRVRPALWKQQLTKEESIYDGDNQAGFLFLSKFEFEQLN